MSHGQAGIVAIKLSLLKSKFTGAYDSTDQLQNASTAATEARVPEKISQRAKTQRGCFNLKKVY